MSLRIRKTVYHNREGYLICGRGPYSGVFGTSVFTFTLEQAARCKDKLNRNEELTLEDLREPLTENKRPRR